MPHAIEIHGDLAAFVASREPGWHRLGITADEDLTVSQGLELAHLKDWQVHTEPIMVPVGEGEDLEMLVSPDQRAIVRTNPFDTTKHDILGLGVTDEYATIQNEEAGEFADALVDGGAVLDAAGSLFGGKRVFMTLRMPEDITIGNTDGDTIRPYLVLDWGHDGKTALTCRGGGVRVVCWNTLAWSMRQQGAPVYRVRHTGTGVQGKVEQARTALNVTFTGAQELADEAAKWAAVEVTRRQFDEITEGLFPLNGDAQPSQVAKVTDQRDSYRNLYEVAPTQANVRGSAWGALNAYTEWSDWFAGNFRDEQARALAQTTSKAMEDRRARGVKIISQVLSLA
jgi:phage/plasmid-like protein (TIGR03299 family)